MKHRLIMVVLVAVSPLIAGSTIAFPAKGEPRAFPDAGVQSAWPTSGAVPDTSAHSAQPPDPIIVEYAGQIGGPTNAVALSGSTLVLVSGSSLLVLDVSDPTHPIELGRLDLLHSMIRDVAIEGDVAYALADRVTIVDLSDPARPREIGTYLGSDQDAQTLDVSGDFVYLSGATMSIVDVSDPEHPVLTGTYSTRDRVNTIQVEGENAYILFRDRRRGESGTLSLGWHQLAARAQQRHRPTNESPHGHTRSPGAFYRIGRYPSISVPIVTWIEPGCAGSLSSTELITPSVGRT